MSFRKNLIITIGSLLVLSTAVWAQTKKPVIELRADPQYFSPDGDKLLDQVFFYPVLRANGSANTEIDRWRIYISKPSGKKVQKLNGEGLPSLIKWNGQSKGGELVSEGEYKSTLYVWGKGYKVMSQPIKLYVDNTPPIVSVQVPNPNFQMTSEGFEPLVFNLAIEDKSPISLWNLQIMDVRGRIVQLFTSTEPVSSIEWDGKNKETGVIVPKGEYRCAFVAWDAAGNESEPAFVDISIDVSTQQMLEQVLQYISIFETDLGLIVQLPAEEIFTMDKGKPILKFEEDVFLKEVAILINAYPDVPVQIDGYSFALKSTNHDRDRSSRYAWTAYSNLVKKGNVKASRLQVRGRGRSPMFERRQADDPPDLEVLKNGVEVILQGNRNWSE